MPQRRRLQVTWTADSTMKWIDCAELLVMYLQHVLQVKMALWQFHDVKLITRDFPELFVTTMSWTVWNVSTATITGKLNCRLHSEMDRLCWTVCNVSTISWEISFNVSKATITPQWTVLSWNASCLFCLILWAHSIVTIATIILTVVVKHPATLLIVLTVAV